jgi:hypothetical protein
MVEGESVQNPNKWYFIRIITKNGFFVGHIMKDESGTNQMKGEIKMNNGN